MLVVSISAALAMRIAPLTPSFPPLLMLVPGVSLPRLPREQAVALLRTQCSEEGRKAQVGRMKLFELAPSDGGVLDEYVYFEDGPGGKLRPRAQYTGSTCPRCGKLNEDGALAAGVDPRFEVVSKLDWFATQDDQICVSDRLKQIFQENSLKGLSFLPIPASPTFHLAVCEELVEVNLPQAGFVESTSCPACGRPAKRTQGPFVGGLQLPHSSLSVFASRIPNENRLVAYRPLFAFEPVVKILRKAKVKAL
jgi:hypothetical protein